MQGLFFCQFLSSFSLLRDSNGIFCDPLGSLNISSGISKILSDASSVVAHQIVRRILGEIKSFRFTFINLEMCWNERFGVSPIHLTVLLARCRHDWILNSNRKDRLPADEYIPRRTTH